MARLQDRTLYLAALGVAVAGLAIDRLVLSGEGLGPGSAAASTVGVAALTGAAPAAAPTAPEHDPTTMLAERLKRLEQDRGLGTATVRNAFWLEGVSRQNASAGPTSIEQAIAAFRRSHPLRAVVSGPKGDSVKPQGGFVVVGDHRLEVGETLDGFTLVEVEVHPRRRAVFDFDGRAVELTLDPKNTTGTGGVPQGRGDASR